MKSALKPAICLSLLMFVLTGCGSARVLVIQKPLLTSVGSVEIKEGEHNISVPSNVSSVFKAALEKNLFEKNGFLRGEELRLEYVFLQADPGDRFARWFWGGIGNAGEASVTVKVSFFDKSNKLLSEIQTESHITSGFFGGSYDSALKKAAKKITEFTVLNFK